MPEASELAAILKLLDEALDLPPGERTAWLAELRRTQPEQAARVEAMLASEARLDRDGFLAEPPSLPPAQDNPLADLQLGAYTLERPLGRGGMGSVWLARRSDGRYQGLAALKLLNLALLDAVGAARFRREGTALARLNHPNIARLLDAGVTETGQPYLVLEYVEGERLDVYCDARRLPAQDRLRVFLQVLEGVAHAHANLIVHRDLKPSNILVTADGTVKLLDFGIAKLLEEKPDAGDAAVTELGWSALTPEYAAPEQVTGEAITTATDVYALGVLLYVLLGGRHPTSGGNRTPSDQLDGVLRSEPARLSGAITAEVAEARGTTIHRLRRRYAGDLENIVAKALRKNPAERYPSVAAFADDLQRHLTHQPVSARPASTWYRSTRFVRRHRAGVAVAASLVVLLAAGAWRERSLRQRAETETRKAREVGNYIVGVFDVADPYSPVRRDPEEVTARTLLDQGARRIQASLAEQPEVQAELRSVLGRAYTNLGLYNEATNLLRQSLTQYRQLGRDGDPAVAEVMARLGDALVEQDRYADAEPLLREALTQRRRLFGNAHQQTAESLDQLANMHQRRAEYDVAEPLFREALAIRREVFGDTSAPVSESLNNLGVLLFSKGADKDAEPAYREALAIDLRVLGEYHPQTAKGMHNLAQVNERLGNYAEAESLYRRALAAKRATLGNAHPSVTVNLNNLANLLIQQDRIAEAEPLIREALALDRQIFGEQHSYVAESLRNMGRVLRLSGRFAEAEGHFREAMAIVHALFGREHSLASAYLNDIGNMRRLQGDLPGAVAYFREALAISRRLRGENHLHTIAVAINLGRALEAQGRTDGVEPLLRDAVGRLDAANATHRPWYVNAQTGLGLALMANGRSSEGRALLEQTMEFARKELGEEHLRTADARLAYGRALLATRRYSEAEPLLRGAAAYFQKRRSTEPFFAAAAAAALAELQRSKPQAAGVTTSMTPSRPAADGVRAGRRANRAAPFVQTRRAVQRSPPG